MYSVKSDKHTKTFSSSEFNFNFNKINGITQIWGKDKEHDAILSKFGPMIADIEVTTICSRKCKWCYKSNNENGLNMSIDTFKRIIDLLPETITQVALGADHNLESNPDIWKMMEYCREKDIVPNITLTYANKKTADKLANLCGGTAISFYDNWSEFYETLENLHSAKRKSLLTTLNQINVHQLISKETESYAYKLITNYSSYLKDKINAIILLSLKQRGGGKHFNQLDYNKYKKIIGILLLNDIKFGFDSCSACKVVQIYKDLNVPVPLESIESCESTLFSCYFNVEGSFYPCSFNEEKEYEIKLPDVNDFIQDIWNNSKTISFRNKLLSSLDQNNLCSCPSFKI